MTEKEIGMGKLMKYVEEMQKEGINICRPQFQQYDLLEMMLISKSYGLVERLVENDKIDFDKVSKKEIEMGLSIVMRGALFIETNWVLMLLSISDTPIDDLISYLK